MRKLDVDNLSDDLIRNRRRLLIHLARRVLLRGVERRHRLRDLRVNLLLRLIRGGGNVGIHLALQRSNLSGNFLARGGDNLLLLRLCTNQKRARKTSVTAMDRQTPNNPRRDIAIRDHALAIDATERERAHERDESPLQNTHNQVFHFSRVIPHRRELRTNELVAVIERLAHRPEHRLVQDRHQDQELGGDQRQGEVEIE